MPRAYSPVYPEYVEEIKSTQDNVSTSFFRFVSFFKDSGSKLPNLTLSSFLDAGEDP